MRHRSLTLLLLLAPLVAGAVPVIDPEELVVGEPGWAVTEMDGGERVRIELEVVGVIGPSAPEGEMVLVRLAGERFEHTGIIAGMSGSPVYVRDRLVGALAFGWAFSKDPIGGVTPFRRMLALAEPAPGATPASTGSTTVRPTVEALAAAVEAGRVGELALEWLLPERETASLRRLQIPVATSLGRPGAWLGAAWDRLGWVDTPAVGAAAAAPAGPLAPGSAVSAILVEGDATLSAGGTVTEVRGDEVWAFGHPFLGGGHLPMPMARGHVVAVLPSVYSSFKFIAPVETVGTLEMDRAHGVWGRLGPSPDLLPIEVRVADREYRFRALRHPVLTPFLVGYVAASSHGARGRTFGEQTVNARVRLVYDGAEAELTEIFSGASAAAEAAGFASAITSFLEGGEFSPPALEKIRVELDPEEHADRARAVDIVADRRTVAPGESVGVRVRLRRHGGAEEERFLSISVPEWLDDGRLDLVVADGASWTSYDLRMRPPSPASFADQVRLLDRVEPSTRLLAVLERKETGLTVPGGAVAAPPGLVVSLGSGLGSNVAAWSYRVVERAEIDLPFTFGGAARIPLTVRSRTAGTLLDGQ